MARWRENGKPLGLLAACGWLTLAVLLLLMIAAAVGYSRQGVAGILAAAVAAGICWVGSFTALLLTASFRGPQGVLVGVLLGMLFRMVPPLAVVVAVKHGDGRLADAGVLGWIVVFFLWTLAVDTLLALYRVDLTSGGSKTS